MSQVQYTDEQLLQILRKYDEQVDGILKFWDYDELRDVETEPLPKTISDRFGGWNEARKEAGIEYNQEYTEQDCIDALQTVLADRKVAVGKYKNYKNSDHPSVSTIKLKLSSWCNAVEQAGLDKNDDYTEEDVIKAIDRVAAELGKSPTTKEYKKFRNDSEPSIQVAKRIFGLWSEAKKKSGFSVLGNNEGKKIDKNSIIESLVRCSKNKRISQGMYSENKLDTEPSKNTILARFGSWNEALKEASLKPDSKYKYTYQELITSIREVRDELGRVPEREEYRNMISSDQPTDYTIKKRIRYWSEAIERANIDEKDEYSEDDLIYAVREVCDGRDLTGSEYEDERKPFHPEYNTIRSQVGGWKEAKRKAQEL